MRIDERGWLIADAAGATVITLPSVRTTALQTSAPLAAVWHATGGVGRPEFAENLVRKIQTYRKGIDRPASWHLLIARSQPPRIYQSASLLVGTWHVGRPGTFGGRRFANVNAATIGIELENAGRLIEVGGKFYAHPYWRDAAKRVANPRLQVSAERVRFFEGQPFDAFTDEQIAVARQLIAALAARFHWTGAELAHSHAELAAPVKTDPGPLWMKGCLPALLAEVFGQGAPPTAANAAPESPAAKESRT